LAVSIAAEPAIGTVGVENACTAGIRVTAVEVIDAVFSFIAAAPTGVEADFALSVAITEGVVVAAFTGCRVFVAARVVRVVVTALIVGRIAFAAGALLVACLDADVATVSAVWAPTVIGAGNTDIVFVTPRRCAGAVIMVATFDAG